MGTIHNTPALKQRNVSEYISGFVDGEGCFSISFTKRSRFIVGWETKPSFSVSQNRDRAQQLFIMQKHFGCGFMRDGKTDDTIKYEVRRLSDLLEKIIPHFEQYPLLSAKQRDVESFKKVCMLMKNNQHTTASGLQSILPIAFSMNSGGKRKYSQKNILAFMKVQMKV
ncbi:LAGLIDADG family homing endonuclease [Patescibacteria group bacterium]|nr:LAGLIDADG family homing endonuclease [Patescibacteria group bacterium]